MKRAIGTVLGYALAVPFTLAVGAWLVWGVLSELPEQFRAPRRSS